jgi:hypothetical protein
MKECSWGIIEGLEWNRTKIIMSIINGLWGWFILKYNLKTEA